MGENIHQEISREYRLLTNDPRVDRVRDIGGKLAKVSDRQDYPYHFFVIDKDEINAFTIPGGRIYFFTGLLNKLKTDEEIAAVLGHEIGHCAARHTVKKFQAALGYNLIGTLVLSQIGGSKERVSTLSRASNIAMQLALSAYGRKDEFESDRLGVKYMFLAGYNLNGMIKTLEVLEQESKGPSAPLILRTHPYVSDRMTAIKAEIQNVPQKYGSP